jgi:hypothetical protein
VPEELWTKVAERRKTVKGSFPGGGRRGFGKSQGGREKDYLRNCVDLVAQGHGSKAVGQALAETEKKVETLKGEVDDLQATRTKVFQALPIEWVRERLSHLREVLERNTALSGKALRKFLGNIRMDPVTPDIGRAYHKATTSIDVLDLLESPTTDPPGGPCVQLLIAALKVLLRAGEDRHAASLDIGGPVLWCPPCSPGPPSSPIAARPRYGAPLPTSTAGNSLPVTAQG